MSEIWWVVKVYDPESGTTTKLSKFGNIEDIKEELKADGLWEFVCAEPEQE